VTAHEQAQDLEGKDIGAEAEAELGAALPAEGLLQRALQRKLHLHQCPLTWNYIRPKYHMNQKQLKVKFPR